MFRHRLDTLATLAHSNNIGTYKKTNISNSFSAVPPKTQTSVVTGHLDLGPGHLQHSLGVYVCVGKEEILADSSGIKTQHSVWMMAQVLPCSWMLQKSQKSKVRKIHI